MLKYNMQSVNLTYLPHCAGIPGTNGMELAPFLWLGQQGGCQGFNGP